MFFVLSKFINSDITGIAGSGCTTAAGPTIGRSNYTPRITTISPRILVARPRRTATISTRQRRRFATTRAIWCATAPQPQQQKKPSKTLHRPEFCVKALSISYQI